MAVKDNESVYDGQIAPLMAQIIEICKTNDLPMAATFEYAPDDYCETVIPVEGQGDHMRRCCALIAGGGGRLPPLQITTTKADGSKIIEVILS